MSLNDNLIAVYHMNNDWLDSVGSNDGTPDGATFDTINKKLGSAAGSFDGIDDKVDLGSGISTSVSGDMSISAWVRMTSDTTNRIIVGNRSGASNIGFEFIAMNAANSNVLLIQADNGPGPNGYRFGTSNIRDNTFHHVVGIRSGSNFIVYVDGTLETGATGAMAGSIQSPGNTYIGIDDAAASSWGKGQYDEINIWNRAITAAEVTQLYNGGAGIELPIAAAGRRRRMLSRNN